MKPGTVEAVRLALHPLFQWSSSHDAVQAALAALTTTPEYQAMAANDARYRVARRYLFPDFIECSERLHAYEAPGIDELVDDAIDAVRGE